jgi:dihydrofolate reductase
MHNIILIAAVAANGVIGKGGQLPFRLPADLARFKQLTMGKTVLMGRKTYESLPPSVRPLPHRTNIVLTRQVGWQPHPAVQVIHSLTEIPAGDLWGLGGAEIYALLLPLATRLELTEVHAEVEGDTFFPNFEKSQWHEVARTANAATATTPAFDFVSYIRK